MASYGGCDRVDPEEGSYIIGVGIPARIGRSPAIISTGEDEVDFIVTERTVLCGNEVSIDRVEVKVETVPETPGEDPFLPARETIKGVVLWG